jgi:hypothetical protein
MGTMTEHDQTVIKDIIARLGEVNIDRSLYWAYMKLYRTSQRLEQLMTDVRIRLDNGADPNYKTKGAPDITDVRVAGVYPVKDKNGKTVYVSVPPNEKK